jgi:GntR family transcriptional regulator, transcriptional repressor for pyruvate dehydrogenase complex
MGDKGSSQINQVGRAVYETVASDLQARIMSGELKPGDRLPAEPVLCAQYGLGRSTMREALRFLASRDLIVTTRGTQGGSFVTQADPALISRQMQTGIGRLTSHSDISAENLLEVRRLIEVPAAGLAAARRTLDDLSGLLNSLQIASTRDSVAILESNRSVHRMILSAAHNPMLEIVAMPIFEVLGTQFRRDQASAKFWEKVHSDHQEMVEAIAAGDSVSAEALAAEHLDFLQPLYSKSKRKTVPRS